jgi:hypothetical protein
MKRFRAVMRRFRAVIKRSKLAAKKSKFSRKLLMKYNKNKNKLRKWECFQKFKKAMQWNKDENVLKTRLKKKY